MVSTRKEAFEMLELEQGASTDQIELSYKQLALLWHPSKHDGSQAAVETFEKLCQAYKMLTGENGIQKAQLSTEEMADLFRKVFDIDGSGESSYDTSDCEAVDNFCNAHCKVSASKALRNGNRLIAEEQQEKAQVQRKKSKKKKRKEKKRQQKEQDQVAAAVPQPEESKDKENGRSSAEEKAESSDEEEEDLDPNSAFVVGALNRRRKQGPPRNVAGTNAKEAKQGEETPEPDITKSRELALRGNEMANLGHYNEAVALITQAIKLYSKEHRYFGNRSYCFYCMERFDRALKDAQHAIELAPTWPKGYFRRGRAQVGLGLLSEARKSFEEVLRLDPFCEEALQELQAVCLQMVCDAGFSETEARLALEYNDWDVEAAVDVLFMGAASVPAPPRPPPVFHPGQPPDVKMNPSNPRGLCSIWVGNVRPEVTEKMLLAIFKIHGEVQSIRVMHDRHCAFINYTNSAAAGRAMDAVQGKELCGTRLLIRYPDSAFADRGPGTLVLKKANLRPNKPGDSANDAKPTKPTGPVNGDECYFWRTTGCSYGDRCRYRHVPQNQGVDLKPWLSK